MLLRLLLAAPRSAARRVTHPFPTRRSSDLVHRRLGVKLHPLAELEDVRRVVHLLPRFREVALERERSRLHPGACRSEEHTSELQSPCNLVCRLLLEKKNSLCESYCTVYIHA